MSNRERSLFIAVVVGTVWGGPGAACNSTPPPVGQTSGATTGSAVTAAGGVATGTAGSPGSGAGGSSFVPVFVIPDASVEPDVTPDAVAASGDSNCGSLQSKLEKKPADLLLVLDRSSSMTEAMDSSNNCAANSTTCSQRWATIIASLNKVLTSSSTDLNWGLKFFSSPGTTSGTGGRGGTGTPGGNCNVTPGVEVPVGSGNATKIGTQISSVGNATTTPTRAAIDAAVAYLKTVNDGNSKYILLATDGEPNCASGSTTGGGGDTDLPATVTAVQNAASAGYKVFVIGVGPEAANLTSLAEAGGSEKFYSALTPDELASALSSIVGTVAAGCTYQLPSEPATPDAVGVFVDKSLIPQSDSDGWSYEAGSSTTININGTYCEDLKEGKKTQVEIFMPCKPSDPIPTIIP
jgi:hypothetical protein